MKLDAFNGDEEHAGDVVTESRIITFPLEGFADQGRIIAPGLDPRCVNSPEALEDALEDKIHRWYRGSEDSSYFVAIDGISGSGKTPVLEAAGNVVAKLPEDVKTFVLPIDRFLGTERGSKERASMADNPELFWHLFYSREDVLDVLKQVDRVNGNSATINVDKLYDRHSGLRLPGQFDVPAGRKVVLVEGVNSFEAIEALARGSQSPILRVMVVTKPETAMKRATQRDMSAGRRGSLEESHAFRRREYKWMVPRVLENNAFMADIVYMNG